MPSGSRWVPPAIELAWTDTAAVPVRRPTRSGGCGRVERCETWLTAPLPPTRRRMRWPRPSSQDAKAYLSSREAQQMSESELERELHRRGQELMRRLLQGHLDQRTPGEAAGPVEGVDDVERSQRRLQEHRPGDDLRDGAGCAPGRVALVDGAETQLNRASAAVDLTVW